MWEAAQHGGAVVEPQDGRLRGAGPVGPWRTVSYVDDFLGMRGGWFLGLHFSVKWQSAAGS
jgi:hypothetical protein